MATNTNNQAKCRNCDGVGSVDGDQCPLCLGTGVYQNEPLPTGHTPGPWHYENGENGRYFPSVLIGPAGGSRGICVNNCSPGGSMQLHQANARLIAAAPDLLEAALRMVRDQDRPTFSMDFQGSVDALRTAIAKATG